ncbi:MAG: serine hydrolase [Bacteroidetes bacterium]|nr:serine hydrolase [Bacteroidota bacterium]
MKAICFLILIPFSIFSQGVKYNLGKYLEAQESINNFYGVVLVMRNDTVLLKKAYGYANRSKNILNNTETKFQIASITKEFTAACILQMEEQGKLKVTDKLSNYFSGFPMGDSITIHMMLCHISGIKGYWPSRMYYSFTHYSEKKAINYLKKQKLEFTPGTNTSYCTTSYYLLSLIIEKVSGQTYLEYIAQHIFQPLKMTNSGCYAKGIKTDNKAKPAKTMSYGFDISKRENFNLIAGAGMIYSNVDDLYKWDRAYYNNSVLSDASKKKKFTTYKSSFGYGESVDTFQTHYRVRHEGIGEGYTSCLYHYTNDNVCIVMLCNNGTNTFAMPEALSAIVFNKPYELPYHHKKIKIDLLLLDNYVGNYYRKIQDKKYIQVIKKNKKLYLINGNEEGVEMKPESNTKFFLEDGSDRQMEFVVDANGKVLQTWLIRGGVKTERIKAL